MRCKNEIRFGILERKAKCLSSSFFVHSLCIYDLVHRSSQNIPDLLLLPLLQQERYLIHCIGIKGIFHIIQIFDQFRIADSKADTHSRHGAGLGKGLLLPEDCHIFRSVQCGCAAKIHIGLIHDHDHIPVMSAEYPQYPPAAALHL